MRELRFVIIAGVAYATINLIVTFLVQVQRRDTERICRLEGALREACQMVENGGRAFVNYEPERLEELRVLAEVIREIDEH